MTLTSLLNIAKSALVTHQRAIDVTAHNIANVTTPGYTRQRLLLQAEVPLKTPQGTIGRGVTDAGVFSDRDVFLDSTFRSEQGTFSQADTLRNLMSRVEDVFGEPSDDGLGASIDSFFSSFSDLANDPSSAPARAVVQQAGVAVVRRFQDVSKRLDEVTQESSVQFDDTITQINSLTRKIGDLNQQIVSSGGPLHQSADLSDERGRLLDQLASLGNVRVLNRTDGSVGVLLGDTLVVDGRFAQTLEARNVPGGGIEAAVIGSPRTITTRSGKLAALTELTSQGIPSVRSELDRLASTIVTQVNTLHSAGTTPGGATGTNFFVPTGTTASTIALAAPIAASGTNIAAGATGASGDGSIALQLAALRTTPFASLNNGTAGAFYAGLLGSLGSIVNDASQEANTSSTLLSGTQAQRSSATGVSTDEELVHLMAQQQAYSAATRLVSVADEMMQDILRMV